MSLVGTPMFIAPEVQEGERYCVKADVYSFGVTVFNLIQPHVRMTDQFRIAFEDHEGESARRTSRICSPLRLQRAITEGMRPALPPPGDLHSASKGFTASLSQLIEDCWQHEAKRRPSFAKVLQRLDTVREDVLAWPDASRIRSACANTTMTDGGMSHMVSLLSHRKQKLDADRAALAAGVGRRPSTREHLSNQRSTG